MIVLGQQLAWTNDMSQNVGRRGTNQLRLLERYLDVLVKHTTDILPPTALVEGTALSALVEGVSLRWFILICEHLISLNQIHAHTCYQLHRGNRSQNLQRLSAFFNGFPIFLNGFPIFLNSFLQWLSNFPQRLSSPAQPVKILKVWLFWLIHNFPLAPRALWLPNTKLSTLNSSSSIRLKKRKVISSMKNTTRLHLLCYNLMMSWRSLTSLFWRHDKGKVFWCAWLWM